MTTFFEIYKGDTFALLTALFWALAVLFFKLSESRYSPLELNIVKNNVSLLGFALTILFFDHSFLLSLSPWQWSLLVMSSLSGVILGDLFFLLSLKKLGASLQAVVDMLYAPTMILGAYWAYGDQLNSQQALGGVLVLMSVFLISYPFRAAREGYGWGFLLGFFSQLSYVVSILLIRDFYNSDNIITITFYRFLIGNIIFMFYWRLKSPQPILGWKGLVQLHLPRPGFQYVILSALLGSFLAVLFWFLGFKYAVAGKVAIYNQMSNLLVVLLALFFLKEKIDLKKSFSLLLGFLGALIVGLS